MVADGSVPLLARTDSAKCRWGGAWEVIVRACHGTTTIFCPRVTRESNVRQKETGRFSAMMFVFSLSLPAFTDSYFRVWIISCSWYYLVENFPCAGTCEQPDPGI